MRNYRKINTFAILLALTFIIVPALTRDEEVERMIGNQLKTLFNDQSKIRKVECEEGGLGSVLFYEFESGMRACAINRVGGY